MEAKAVKKRIWKPNLYRLGLLLTLLVVAIDWVGWIDRIERPLYDARAKYCQQFTPPPTDRIVHIDIDDESLEEIGKWAWPRWKLARLLDEISRAKPKVIGFDIYFSEFSDEKSVADDDEFAAAIQRAGNVLLPVSIKFETKEAPDEDLVRVKALLARDLELTYENVVDELRRRGSDAKNLELSVRRILSRAREEAMLERLTEEVTSGLTDFAALQNKLVPHSAQSGIRSDAMKQLEQNYPKAMAINATKRFRYPLIPGVLLAIAPGETAVNIQKFAESLHYSGFVDLPRGSGDGIVRSIPLLVNYRGGAFPHMALALACALLDINPKDIRYTSNSILLPVPGREPIAIPCRTEWSSNLGYVGAIVDVPYWGQPDEGWLTMYDFPRYREATAHIPIRVFWTFCQRGESMRNNNAVADKALKELADVFQPEAALKYLKNKPDLSDTESRLTTIDATVKELSEFFADMLKVKESERSAEDKATLGPFLAIQNIARVNRETYELLKKDRLELQNQLQGKVVIVGSTGTGAADFYPTSLHPKSPGAVIQGAVINGILTGNLWRRAPHWMTALTTLAVGVLTTLLVALLPAWRALVCTALVAGGFAVINGIVLFDRGNFILGAAGPLLTSALVWGGLTLTNVITEARERARIRKRFTNYVDPAIVKYMEDHPEKVRLDGERREMTVVFTDLAGFTTISEKLGESTVPLLNDYFGKMVPVVRNHRGLVNKFLGDGLMFFYNAPEENPNHAVDAVQTVIDMRKQLVVFNAELQRKGLPECGMRAGMTTGMMVVGDAGSKSDDEKINASDYTVLGDRVNLAARLEGVNKLFGSNLMMNERTRELIGDRFLCRPIGKIVVKGKSEHVMTFEALCNIAEATPEQLLHAALSAKVVEAYQASEFEDCIKLCDELEEKTRDEEFADTYRKLAHKLMNGGFDGVFEGQIIMTEK